MWTFEESLPWGWGWCWNEFNSILWVLQVLDLLLDLNLDYLALPLGCLMVPLPWGGLLLSWGPLCVDLQHVLKWFLFPHLWHFMPHAGHSLSGWDMLHLPHVLPGPPLALWTLPFLNFNVLILSMVVAVAIPPLDLCQLKSFTVISCSLACCRRAWYITSSLFFFDLTHFSTSKCLVTWKSNSVLCTIFLASTWYWYLSSRSLMHLSNWSVFACSPCLMLL